jgi:hypothetical protein
MLTMCTYDIWLLVKFSYRANVLWNISEAYVCTVFYKRNYRIFPIVYVADKHSVRAVPNYSMLVKIWEINAKKFLFHLQGV